MKKNHAIRQIAFACLAMMLLLAGGRLAMAAEPSQKAKDLQATLAAAIDKNEKLGDKAKQFAKDTLLPLCLNEVFIAETKAQNAKKVKLDEIKKIDAEWTKAEEELPIQKEKLTGKCAEAIKKIAKDKPTIVEAFVMDDQGAVVGENSLTSDYWQGDEPKWAESFNKGKGGLNAGKVELDKSTNVQLQQISLPIIDLDGTVIGAVTYGVAVDKL